MQSGTESQPGTGELADDTRVANADDKQRMPLHADEAGGNGGEVGTELGSEGQDPEVSMATSDTAEDSEAEGGQAGDGEADDIADEPPDTLAMAELRQLTASFPLEKRDIERVTALIHACGAEELTRLGLGAPPRPRVPRNLDKMPVQQRIKTIQGIISAYQYNHTPDNYFNVNKDRPFCRIMDTARDIQRDALPIKCIEGAILGLFFTCGQEDLDRMALRFKTTAGGNVYRHIVLAMRHRPSGKWGAIGLSRRQELMYKPMGYASLADLVTDYKESYEQWFHKVLKVRVGLPAEHNLYYSGRINWCYTVLKPQEKSWAHWRGALEKHTAGMRKGLDHWRQTGTEAQKEGKDGPMWTAYRRSAVFDNRTPQAKGQRRGTGKGGRSQLGKSPSGKAKGATRRGSKGDEGSDAQAEASKGEAADTVPAEPAEDAAAERGAEGGADGGAAANGSASGSEDSEDSEAAEEEEASDGATEAW
eukprot:jgi/Tetstr1/431172/TSEL_020884.t1